MAKKKSVTEDATTETAVETLATEAPAPTTEPEETQAPKKKGKKRARAAQTDENLTLEDLAAKYLEHLEVSGKSNGTLFSYKLELITALDELGKDSKLADLTSAKVLDYFVSDRVTKTRTGVLKANPTVDKTRRVLRLALQWAQETGLIAAAPLPELAARY